MLKVLLKKGGKDFALPSVPAGDSGSLRGAIDGESSIIIFRCEEDDSGAFVHRVERGIEVVMHPYRALLDSEMTLLAALEPGESYEMSIGVNGARMDVVFEHEIGKGKIH